MFLIIMNHVTMICMDTSSWMGTNKSPSFLAQADAIHLFCQQKLDFHPENCVGILAMGMSTHILVKPTRKIRKIMSRIYGAQVDYGNMRILDALKSAGQCLKTKSLRKRIAVFAGGPVYWFKHDLIAIGTKLKKKGVAVDVVNFGDKNGPKGGVIIDPCIQLKDNSYSGQSKKEILEALVAAANDNDNSHILHVPDDQLSLREHLSRSAILCQARREQLSSSESIIAWQKAEIDRLTRRNEKLKRKLDFFSTESLNFARKIQDHNARKW